MTTMERTSLSPLLGPRRRRALGAGMGLALVVACATPLQAIKDQVRQQATADLVCDHASLHVVQLRPLKKVQGGKQTIERGSFSAKGCGGYATYAVECIRGACAVQREIDETLDGSKQKTPGPTEAGTP